MASETPFSGGELDKEYTGRWTDIGRLMLDGWSWSGRERDVVHMNRGGARFADISAASGLDFAEDGRALAACDWDSDGRVDLILRNRNTPGLRFLRGNSNTQHHWVAFALRGTHCNRDAIGARITLSAGGVQHVRELRAGDGYLSQSSKVLHFGLGTAATVASASVRWPDGTVQQFTELAGDTLYELVQGAAAKPRAQRAAFKLETQPHTDLAALRSTRMVLRTPLPLPLHLRPANNRDRVRGTTALLLYSSADADSATVLQALSAARPELESAELNIALCTDAAPPSDLFPVAAEGTWWTRFDPKAQPALRAIVDQLRGARAAHAEPALLLIDAFGRLQSVHFGKAGPADLYAEATALADPTLSTLPRSSFAGRWYYGHLPDIEGLAAAVRVSGDSEATGFYVLMALELQRKLRQGR